MSAKSPNSDLLRCMFPMTKCQFCESTHYELHGNWLFCAECGEVRTDCSVAFDEPEQEDSDR